MATGHCCYWTLFWLLLLYILIASPLHSVNARCGFVGCTIEMSTTLYCHLAPESPLVEERYSCLVTKIFLGTRGPPHLALNWRLVEQAVKKREPAVRLFISDHPRCPCRRPWQCHSRRRPCPPPPRFEQHAVFFQFAERVEEQPLQLDDDDDDDDDDNKVPSYVHTICICTYVRTHAHAACAPPPQSVVRCFKKSTINTGRCRRHTADNDDEEEAGGEDENDDLDDDDDDDEEVEEVCTFMFMYYIHMYGYVGRKPPARTPPPASKSKKRQKKTTTTPRTTAISRYTRHTHTHSLSLGWQAPSPLSPGKRRRLPLNRRSSRRG